MSEVCGCHPAHDTMGLAHGGDFVPRGPVADLGWVASGFAKAILLEIVGKLGRRFGRLRYSRYSMFGPHHPVAGQRAHD